MSKTYTIHYGATDIDFELHFKSRKTLGIQVQPDCSVKVNAPIDSEIEKVLTAVQAKAAWIIKQKDYFRSFLPTTTPRQYVAGETHLYLGRQYQLRIWDLGFQISDCEPDSSNPKSSIHNPKFTEGVVLTRGYLHLYTANRDKEHLQCLLNTWYQLKAESHFRTILQEVLPLFHRYKISPPTLHIRFMEKRWGSCTPQGKIILNTALIRAPKGCIRYVLIHELCHLIQPDHTQAFYQLQERILPDFGYWKERLERVMV